MTKNRDLKSLIRARMEKTGESYAAARRHVVGKADGSDPSATRSEPPGPLLSPHGGHAAGDAGNRIKGWFLGGEAPEDYDFGTDPTQRHQGAASAVVRARGEQPAGSVTLMQHFLAEDYRQRRLRLSGWVKTEGTTVSCNLWMRIDENTRLLIFTTSPRAARGTCDWTQQHVVLDVDEEATMISIGAVVHGAGSAWLAGLVLDIVGTDVPLTASRNIPRQPTNLDFSE